MITALTLVAIMIGLRQATSRAPRTAVLVRGTIAVTVHGELKRDASGVVVYLEDVPGPPPAPTAHASIRQIEKQFDPPLTIVVKGTTVDFPNEDKIFHNVFSVSRPARFDLGLYKSGTTKSVEMKRTGTVDVYCNIHPDMIAKVKVLDNGYYTSTDANGKFQIDGIPAGEYPIVRVDAEQRRDARGTVTVQGRRARAGRPRGQDRGASRDAYPEGRHAIRTLQVALIVLAFWVAARVARCRRRHPCRSYTTRVLHWARRSTRGRADRCWTCGQGVRDRRRSLRRVPREDVRRMGGLGACGGRELGGVQGDRSQPSKDPACERCHAAARSMPVAAR